MATELKPCPFCGGEAIYITTAIKAGNTVKEFYSISCLLCNAEIYKYCKTEEEAIKAWNKRAAKTPCDLCKFNPPSSMDGKPCTMCVADGRAEDGN